MELAGFSLAYWVAAGTPQTSRPPSEHPDPYRPAAFPLAQDTAAAATTEKMASPPSAEKSAPPSGAASDPFTAAKRRRVGAPAAEPDYPLVAPVSPAPGLIARSIAGACGARSYELEGRGDCPRVRWYPRASALRLAPPAPGFDAGDFESRLWAWLDSARAAGLFKHSEAVMWGKRLTISTRMVLGIQSDPANPYRYNGSDSNNDLALGGVDPVVAELFRRAAALASDASLDAGRPAPERRRAVRFTSALVVWYLPGATKQSSGKLGWHRDAPCGDVVGTYTLLRPGGTPRPFLLRRHDPKLPSSRPAEFSVEPRSGDFMFQDGSQEAAQHAVGAVTGSERVSFSFRYAK